MPLGTPMPTAPWANQGGGNVVAPWKPPKAPQQQTPTVSRTASGGIAVSFVPPTAAQYSSPFTPVGDIARRVGAAGVQTAQQVGAGAYREILAAQAQGALADANYNRTYGDTLLGRAKAETSRNQLIAAMQGDTTSALGQLANDRFRTVDLGLQGVQADRNYVGAMQGAFDQETVNINSDVNAQREFLARAFGIEVGQLDQLLGFAGEDRDITNRALDAQTGFAGERRSLSDRGSQLSYDQNSRQALSDATARGAVSSKGFGDTRSELARQLGLAKEGSDLGYRTDLSGIGTQREQNSLGFRRTEADVGTRRSTAELNRDKGNRSLDSTLADRQVAASRQSAGYQKALSDASIREASIGSVASDMNIKEGDLRRKLQQGLDAAGLDYTSAIDALESNLQGSADQQAYAKALIQYMTGT